jgi:hypothetical protein
MGASHLSHSDRRFVSQSTQGLVAKARLSSNEVRDKGWQSEYWKRSVHVVGAKKPPVSGSSAISDGERIFEIT